jgi:HEAT repeat protein
MSDVDKIVRLLSSTAIEKQIAAAIVLGEIGAKGARAVDGLAAALDSGVGLLQRHALDALARVGAARAVPKILPLLASREEEVRRAAIGAMVSVGEAALPAIRGRMPDAGHEERRSLDAVLAALGGKDAFHVLLEGLASSDAEAAKAATIAVRQRVKDADARQRGGYLAEAERFLDRTTKAKGSPVALAAGVKILGYLEDARAVPTLLGFARSKRNEPGVRQEALIALRFLLAPREGQAATGGRAKGAPSLAAAIAVLVEAAEDEDRSLAQTALHTLSSLRLPGSAAKRLEKLVSHPDTERARLALEMVSQQPGEEHTRVLVGVLASTREKRRAEMAAACLVAREGPDAPGAPGSSPVRDDAVLPLARALLASEDADRAWLLRSVLRPSAGKVPAGVRKQLLDAALARMARGARNWEPLLAAARDAAPHEAAEALRGLARKVRAASPDKALTALRVLCRMEASTDDDRYLLAAAELSRGAHDTRASSREADEALRLFGALLERGVDVGSRLRKDRSLELEDLYYLGFHFAERGHALGAELLQAVVDRGGRAKIAKMARSKLALAEPA